MIRIKNIKELIVQLCTYIAVIVYIFNTSSCANTKTGPSGGPKDTLAPIVIGVYPDSNALNVPTSKQKITLTFNEYVQIKDAQKNILLSPPQKKRPETKIKGKSVVVSFPEDLDSSKTYSLSFGSALADNNEGNVLENYVYSFSTGDTIDSLLISGAVYNSSTLLPMEGVTIALYKEQKDSSVLNTLPDAVAKSDKWGYFTVRNLKSIPYSIYAFNDENYNSLYDPDLEQIGFIDSMVTPTTVMKKGLPQLAPYLMTDTLLCLARPQEVTINLFKERPTIQYIKNYERITKRAAFIKFNAPDVIIDSFSIRGIRQDHIIKQFNYTNDSLAFWINEDGEVADTLQLGIKYHKTDSLGVLNPFVENLKLVAPFEKKETNSRKERGKEGGIEGNKERKDLLKFNLVANPEMIEQNGYVFEFSEPLVNINTDTITFTSSTPKKVVTNESFTIKSDSLDITRYILKPQMPFIIGYDYQLTLPKATFTDINGNTNDSTYNKLSLPTDDKLSSLTLYITNVNTRYVVELITSKRDKVYRSYSITEDCTLLFPYLKEGEYSIRVFEDRNSNSIIDPGNIINRIQPESVLLYKLPDGKDIIEIMERTDIEQSIDMGVLFGKEE